MVVIAPGKYPPHEFHTPLLQQCLMIPQQNQQQQYNGYPPINQPRPRNNYEIKPARLNLVPMTYNQILAYVIHKGWVRPKALIPMKPLYPPNFDVNARCQCHVGSPGPLNTRFKS